MKVTTRPPPPPWGTVVWDRLTLFHPRVWWRVSLYKRVAALVWRPLFTSAAAILLPVCAYSCYCCSASTRPQHSGLRKDGLATTYFCSPWIVAWTWKALISIQSLCEATWDLLTVQQSNTLPEAMECLQDRVHICRAYRERGYDVYLPPPLKAKNDNHTDDGDEDSSTLSLHSSPHILFFPGATVDHTAYSCTAAMMSDAGYLVVVLSAEPLRFVDTELPRFRAERLRRIQRRIEHCQGSSASCIQSNDDTSIKSTIMPANDWILIGHSMGSLACTKLAPELRNVKGIVLWGSAPFLDHMRDLSSQLDLSVLVVQATNDNVIQAFATPDTIRRFWEMLPAPTTIRHDIVGGTHSGFGHYASCWKSELEGIPIGEQQREAVDTTIRFLKQIV